MDVSRNVTKTAVSRSANWTTSIIRTTSTSTSSTAACPHPPPFTRGITASSNNPRHTAKNRSSSNSSVKFRNKGIYRGLQNLSSNEPSSSSTHLHSQPERPEASHGSKRNPSTHPDDPSHPQPPQPGIRERLRRWQIENLAGTQNVQHEQDYGKMGSVSNSVTRPNEGDELRELDDYNLAEGSPLPLFEADDLVGFGSERSFLLRGDLVELRTLDGIRIELAIFVRELEHQSQFYTMTGRWVHKASRNARFFVPNFVSPADVEPLMPYLPSADVPEALQDKLQNFEHALPRSVGGPLLQKMADFGHAVDDVYRQHLDVIDDAYNLLSLPKQARSLSLPSLTKELLKLPQTVASDSIPPATLYAVYRSLMSESLGFRPQTAGNTRAWGRFEIVPRKLVDSSRMVTRIVRAWQGHVVAAARAGVDEDKAPPGQFIAEFQAFLTRARRAIDISRQHRATTTHGQVGPATVGAVADAEDGAEGAEKVTRVLFNTSDLRYIRFIKSWAAWQTFALSSTLHGVGSAILRATGRYEKEGTVLDQATGWVFLQELGVVAPWETRTPFELRVPGFGYYRDNSMGGEKPMVEPIDPMKDLRKDWGEATTVYCIDDASAHEIDDGVSVEATETAGEHWVHVHVADPGSLFSPSSSYAVHAKQSIQTIYLPDRVIPMLPDHIVQDKLSLAPDRPTLTFSARVNASGDLLDHKITPGTIRKVVYLTPATLAEVLGHTPAEPHTVLSVGDPDVATTYNAGVMPRALAPAAALSATDKANLALLASLGAARRARAALRGAVHLDQPRTTVTVRIAASLAADAATTVRSATHFRRDPHIALAVTRPAPGPAAAAPVTALMLLAAEVAATWCKARAIPLVYRVTQAQPDKPDAAAHFRAHVRPHLQRGDGAVPAGVMAAYLRALGPVLPSAVPGPHVALGVDAYAKVTSPLRRYGDLVAHWQIQSALLEEARTGRSLAGSRRGEYLAVSRAAVEALVPRLDGREKELAEGQRGAERSWGLQAVLRAWRFGEGEVGGTWGFTAGRMMRGWVMGEVEGLGLRGIMDLPADLTAEEVAEGDVFEVRIRDVNPYERRLLLEPLRRVSTAADLAEQ